MNQIDEPADDNTWHDVPNLSPANLKAQAKEQYNKNKPLSQRDLQNAAGDATQAAHPSGSRDPQDAAQLQADAQQQGTDSGMDPQAGAQVAKDNLASTAKQNISSKIPDEHKENARNTRDRTQNYLKNKVPKERRDQTIFRLKKMIVEIQSHSDCSFPPLQAPTGYLLTTFQTNKQLRRSFLLQSNMEDTAKTLRSRVLAQ